MSDLDVCPECGEHLADYPPGHLRPPGREFDWENGPGNIAGYVFVVDGDLALRIELKCMKCGWERQGELAFDELEADDE